MHVQPSWWPIYLSPSKEKKNGKIYPDFDKKNWEIIATGHPSIFAFRSLDGQGEKNSPWRLAWK
jgi:hypothetical protein